MMQQWLPLFINIGDRRAVYDELLSGLPATLKYSQRQRLDCALAVAGIGPDAEHTLNHYWPHERPHRPLFANARDYMPRILALAAKASYGLFRGHAVHIMPSVDRAEFTTWAFDDTTMPLPQRLMIAVKLNEPDLFGAMLEDLKSRSQESGRTFLVYSPPLTLDYHVGPDGPFIYLDGDRQIGVMPLTPEQLFQLLAVPAMAESETHGRYFKAVVPQLKIQPLRPGVSLDRD